jgi:hypothetical protein
MLYVRLTISTPGFMMGTTVRGESGVFQAAGVVGTIVVSIRRRGAPGKDLDVPDRIILIGAGAGNG